MTKLSLGNFKLSFGPKSAIVQHLQAQFDDAPRWNLQDNELILEFDIDPNAPLLPPHANYLSSLMRARSPSTAESVLKGISFTLRRFDEFDVPRHLKVALADALDRVIEKGESGKFLYGKQGRRGKPNKDLLEEFHVFETVELVHSVGEPYSASGPHDGAYHITAKLLKEGNIGEKKEDEIRRIRSKVLKTASKDLEYFSQLVQYLVEKGYKISQ